MGSAGAGCGPLHALYRAAREGDSEMVEAVWDDVEGELRAQLPDAEFDAIEEAFEQEDPTLLRRRAADRLFEDAESPTLDGWPARVVGTVLYLFGYIASFVLFYRAHTPTAVVGRLRWAYRTVGVDIRDREAVDGVERTTFKCPYRNLGADRVGRRHACHDVLDRVDDGYVTFLARHRDIDYQRPRACAASECCYSEVAKS